MEFRVNSASLSIKVELKKKIKKSTLISGAKGFVDYNLCDRHFEEDREHISISCALEGKTVKILGDGEQTRSYIYVDDLIEFIYPLVSSNYNLKTNNGKREGLTIN